MECDCREIEVNVREEQYDVVIYEQFFFLGKHLADKYDKPVMRAFTKDIAKGITLKTDKKYINIYI